MNFRQVINALAFTAVTVVPLTVAAQDLRFALPESVGMSSAVLDTATARLQRHIEAQHIAGVVAAVARDNRIIYFQSLGFADIESGRAMTDNALFRVYSMTRQITSAAILMLVEDGLLELDAPVSRYLPQFDPQKVFLDPESPQLDQVRDRSGEITIAHLLTHTGGLGPRSAPIYVENQVRDRAISLDQMVDNAARMPLFADPGTEFRYGISATILGKVVEAVSAMPLQQFLEERLFAPVGMRDTVFWADRARAGRLTTVYRAANDTLYPTELETVPFNQQPALIEGGVGLLSTVMDYLRFSQMLLNGGSIDGRQVLAPDTVQLIFANAVPPSILPLADQGYWRGSGWTLGGFNVVLDRNAYDFPVSEGTIWWDGSAGTRYFIDPGQGLVIVIMAQVSPAGGAGFREEFKQLVDGAILQRR